MLQLSTASILEKNKIAQDSAWLTLLEVQAPDGDIIRSCHYNEDIIWNGPNMDSSGYGAKLNYQYPA